jgi:hypothetical protein
MSGWKNTDLTFGAGGGAWAQSFAYSTTLRALEERYEHGYLVTIWINYTLEGYVPLCRYCALKLTANYSIRSGNKLNSYGSVTNTIRTVPFMYGDARYRERWGFANAPRNYGHAVVWIPRAWGRPGQFGVQGGLTLNDGGGVGYSISMSAAYSKAVYLAVNRT